MDGGVLGHEAERVEVLGTEWAARGLWASTCRTSARQLDPRERTSICPVDDRL